MAKENREPDIDPDDYFDSESALIKYGLLVMGKNKDQKLLTAGDDMALIPDGCVALSEQQVQYLNMRMAGVPLRTICETLSIPPVLFSLWKEQAGEGSLYCTCLDLIEQINADMAEDITRDEAQKNRRNKEERMFYIKRWKPEYRDNYQGAGANLVQINITVDDKPYTVDVNTKVVDTNGK